MNRFKKSVIALLTLLIMLFFVAMPTNAKRVHHHRTHILQKVRIKRYHHKNRHYYKKKKVCYKKRKQSKPQQNKIPVLPSKPQFSKRDYDDINNDRQFNGLSKLDNNKALQKIAIDRVTLAYTAWQNGWDSHGSDGKTATAAQLGFNTNSKDYNSNISIISENNAILSQSPIPISSSMVDGKMNYFNPKNVSTPNNIIDTNNDIYMNHDVGADGQSGHRANILDSGINSVGTAIYQKNGYYVQDEVFGTVN